jgi:hypothetical protein
MDLTLGQSYSPNFSAFMFLRWGVRLLLMAELRTLFGRAKPAMAETAMPMAGEAKAAA